MNGLDISHAVESGVGDKEVEASGAAVTCGQDNRKDQLVAVDLGPQALGVDSIGQ